MEKMEKVSFIPVTDLFVSRDGRQKWLHLYAMEGTESGASLAKEQIERGVEAIATLAKLKEYYAKVTEQK